YYSRAHSGVAYNPDTLTGEGINRLALARQQQDSQTNLTLARLRAETAIKQDSFDAQQHFLLARVLRQQDKLDQAIVEYRKAIRLDPFNQPDYYNDLAQILLVSDPQAALQVASSGLNAYPDQVLSNRMADPDIFRQVSTLLTTRALVLLKVGDQAKAVEDLRRAYVLNQKNLQAKQLLEQISSH
ncbi:MAG TPA: tetratricopeptide repeat protein, partial [Candidatus Nanoarchaeia archaeon]|nr:tetratricopeptide repeat protein [Candidatus Nanoarchaeia archaeon]